MKIFILSSGDYGSKIVNGIATHGLASNIVGIHEFPSHEELPEFIDNVSEYIPKNIPDADLIIAVGIHGDLNLTIPDVVKTSGAQSVIAPLYHPKQLPLGLQNEIKKLLPSQIAIVFPMPFCSLTPVGDKYIDKFVETFGKPIVNIEHGEEITNVEVVRGAPCGSTWYIADNLRGISIKNAEFEAANKFHNFPCSASMTTDHNIGETYLHLAGFKTTESIKRALGFTYNSAVVDPDTCEGLNECDNLCINSCPNVLAGDHTIYHNSKDDKARIDPGSCGVCEVCVRECPYGAINILDEKIAVNKTPDWK
ncbi:DUF166 domain-containing protein [Methanobrevibacter filiformis]|uniref:4Fe-4S ferredoxin-type domain-containing protein n=1 Tax=Methanobrevibacter filiformis TaxID=55758 RepID=A0A166F4W6_9EURY|nr:DUF166 family protein [Methanobrevibacter filiformis]KZX17316.1 hypothetical protein MBFIL_02290 [Methanobrevibacter filiformis]